MYTHCAHRPDQTVQRSQFCMHLLHHKFYSNKTLYKNLILHLASVTTGFGLTPKSHRLQQIFFKKTHPFPTKIAFFLSLTMTALRTAQLEKSTLSQE